MIEYNPQSTGTELGLFQALFASCNTPQQGEKMQQLLLQMLSYLSIPALGRLMRVNRTFHGFVSNSAFFKELQSRPENLRALPDLLWYFQSQCPEDQRDEFRGKIIAALKAGADPTQIPGGKYPSLTFYNNTVLTAALVRRDGDLINAVFEIISPRHPLYSLKDQALAAKNTPLSLALKTGRYDIALRLVVEKQCDVDGLISVEGETSIHPLHLCAFLLVNCGGDSLAQKQEIVRVMEAILERSTNKEPKLYWGQTPWDVLMLKLDEGDFEVFEDQRDFFEYNLGTLFTAEEVATSSKIMEMMWMNVMSQKNILYYQGKGEHEEAAKELKKLEDAEKALSELNQKYPQVIEFAQALTALIASNNFENDFENRKALQKITFERWPNIKTYLERKAFSRNDLIKEYQNNPPEYFKSIGKYGNSRGFNVAYMLVDHCIWHRSGVGKYDKFFDSAEGQAILDNLSHLMRPTSPSLM